MSAVDYREAVWLKIQFNRSTLGSGKLRKIGGEATSRRKKIRIIRIAGSDKPVELRKGGGDGGGSLSTGLGMRRTEEDAGERVAHPALTRVF